MGGGVMAKMAKKKRGISAALRLLINPPAPIVGALHAAPEIKPVEVRSKP
jgi:hypothetical protein